MITRIKGALIMPETITKRTFEVDGTTYAVRVPTVDEIKGANGIRATTFNEALSRGDMLRDQLEGELRKRRLWNDEREQEYQTLRQEVLDGEYTLQKGGIRLSQARSTALEMSDKRAEMVELLSSRTDLDSNTCEGKADAVRFNYLFAHCLVYDETGEPYFPNKLDDYLENQNDAVAVAGATEFYYLISGSESVDEKLPETKFLKKFKFYNNDGRLVDKDGRLITRDGKHVDEDGNYVQWEEDGTSVKIDNLGRPVKEDGDFNIEHSPFLDEEDSAIDESVYEEVIEETIDEEVAVEADEESEEKPKPKPKRGRKKAVKVESEIETAIESDI